MKDWAEFDSLREGLIAAGRFERVAKWEQRLMYVDGELGFRIPVDLIPFHGVASEAKTIAWPPEGDFVMNVAGFEEALEAALYIDLEPGLVIAVASLPGLAILKILAWVDRHLENNKDAADLYRLLSAYDIAGNEDRLFGSEIQLLEAAGYDLTLAGAQLLGRDAARIADSVAARQIVSLLKSDARRDALIIDMVKTASYEENANSVASMWDCFRRGFLEIELAVGN